MPAVMLAVFALTLFVSASLLFIVQPMVGKMMLPLMGGTPAVWNTCMVFFQAILLAGYAYAHAITTWLGPRKQARLHLAVLVAAVPLVLTSPSTPACCAPNEELVAGRRGQPHPRAAAGADRLRRHADVRRLHHRPAVAEAGSAPPTTRRPATRTSSTAPATSAACSP